MHRRSIALASFAAAVVFAGCAQPGYDPSKLQRELQNAGATREQAVCVTDAMGNTFDPGQLASRSEPSARELATTANLLKKCGVRVSPTTR